MAQEGLRQVWGSVDSVGLWADFLYVQHEAPPCAKQDFLFELSLNEHDYE